MILGKLVLKELSDKKKMQKCLNCGKYELTTKINLKDDIHKIKGYICEDCLKKMLNEYINEYEYKINDKVWFTRNKGKAIGIGKIYGFVNDKTYRIRTHNGHLTKDVANLYRTKKEAQEKLKGEKDESNTPTAK